MCVTVGAVVFCEVDLCHDKGVPRPLRALLRPHHVVTAEAQGWDHLTNGQLLDTAEKYEFDVLITADKNLQHQQRFSHRKLAVLVLSHSKWPDVKLSVSRILEALQAVTPGTCIIVSA